jgi:DUF971 family protein
MNSADVPVPSELKLKKGGQSLDVTFPDGPFASLPAEYLRVHSPSAEVTGHSAGEGVLVTGKQSVSIARIEPVGRYAVRIVFDDGHDSGLFTWHVLHDLSVNLQSNWDRYLERLAEAGQSRSAAS